MQNIGELKFYCDDLDREVTLKEYFRELIITLWEEGEGFSGKRPFGNSGWEYRVHYALLDNGIIKGKRDEYNEYWEEYDRQKADEIILNYLKTEF